MYIKKLFQKIKCIFGFHNLPQTPDKLVYGALRNHFWGYSTCKSCNKTIVHPNS